MALSAQVRAPGYCTAAACSPAQHAANCCTGEHYTQAAATAYRTIYIYAYR
jgi:hypothetical protein